MGRPLLKLLWTPFLSKFVQMLGFSTEKMQTVVKNGIDHHHTRQILLSCLYAHSKELLVPFICDCQTK